MIAYDWFLMLINRKYISLSNDILLHRLICNIVGDEYVHYSLMN